MEDIQVQLTKVSPLEALPSMELVPPILICQSYWVLNLQTLKIQLTWSVQNHVLPLPPHLVQPVPPPQIVPTLQLLHANPTSRIAWQGRALSRCCTICFLFSSFCLFDFLFCLAPLHDRPPHYSIFVVVQLIILKIQVRFLFIFIMIHSAVNYEQKL